MQRVITGIVIAILILVLLILGSWWLRFALLAVSLVGLYEFFRAFSKSSMKISPIHFAAYLFAIIHFLLVIGSGQEHILLMFAMFVLLVIALTVMFYQNIKVSDSFTTIGGFFYVPFLLSFVYIVRSHDLFIAGLIFVSASACDVFAYLVGCKFGKHKLTGTPSSGKSWEGCIGGVIGAALVGLLYGYAALRFAGAEHPILVYSALIAAIGAIFSQFGDLFASAIKRSVGIKDFGSLLPGHGGVLDRFDSILVSAPMVYIMMIGIELWI